MKTILLFGAGKSASVLIDYLLGNAVENDWKLLIADADKKLIEEKTKKHPNSMAVELDINNETRRRELISSASIVISMMPPTLHILVARDCIHFGKNLLTASYADEEIRALNDLVKQKGILFLCEMGLDPGIDHMSAMQLIDEIRSIEGNIQAFKSHCGGLIAPESDDNPWHYKITWNPKNIVLAGKAGAIYKEDGRQITENYDVLFDDSRTVETGHAEVKQLCYYPNRNSLPYIDLYGLDEASTFVRTTLRYPDFMLGWKNVIELGLTSEAADFDSSGKSLRDFFMDRLSKQKISLGDFKNRVSEKILEQFRYIGLEDAETLINKGVCSAADVLQLALEKKLALKPQDKDMIVMLHEISYSSANGKRYEVHSSLLVKGDDHIHTAMAKTVGLPLGIAAKLILEGRINLTGVCIPVNREIYEPVLEELKNHGVSFIETIREV